MKDFLSSLISKFKEYLILILLLSISLSILTLNEKPEMKKLRTFAFGGFASLNGLISGVSEYFSDHDKIKLLEKENAQLMLKVNRLREYGIENDELKKLLALRDTADYSLLPASIVFKSTNKFQGYVIINLGTDQNVHPQMPVINHKGLIGIVQLSSTEYSLVRTLRNSKLRAAVRNQRSGFNGILVYDGVNLLVKNIPASADMKIGDRIVTSEFSTLFPPSIPIGFISEEELDITGLLNNLTIEPFVNFNELGNLFVMQIPITNQIDSLESQVENR